MGQNHALKEQRHYSRQTKGLARGIAQVTKTKQQRRFQIWIQRQFGMFVHKAGRQSQTDPNPNRQDGNHYETAQGRWDFGFPPIRTGWIVVLGKNLEERNRNGIVQNRLQQRMKRVSGRLQNNATNQNGHVPLQRPKNTRADHSPNQHCP